VIPEGNDQKAVIAAESLLSAVRRVGIFSDSFTKRVTLSLESGKVRVSVQTQDIGEAEEELEARYDGEAMRISYNAAYLIDMLKTMESAEVEMAFKGPMQAGLFRPTGEKAEDLLCLVMPLRLPDEETPATGETEESAKTK
jgi:DNA polymerase-3 subunit beta